MPPSVKTQATLLITKFAIQIQFHFSILNFFQNLQTNFQNKTSKGAASLENICQNHQQALRKEQLLKRNTAQKMKFPLRISSVNVTKTAVSCGFGHIY